MPLALLIPLLAPVITEFLKWFVAAVIPNSVIGTIPSTLIPAVSAAAGGVLALTAPMVGMDLGVDPAIGVGLGLAGTGVHATIRSAFAPALEV